MEIALVAVVPLVLLTAFYIRTVFEHRSEIEQFQRAHQEALDAAATAQRIARNALAENRVLRERIARGTAAFHAPLAQPVKHCAECDPIFPCFKEGNCIREGAGA